MGIFNIFQLAKDYSKAKKLLKEKNIDAKKMREAIDSLQELIAYIKNFIVDLEEWIYRIKNLMGDLAVKLQKKGDK